MESRQFLLDTNIVSHLVRHPQGIVRDRIVDVGEQTVCVSLLVATELRFALGNALARTTAFVLSPLRGLADLAAPVPPEGTCDAAPAPVASSRRREHALP
jgi:tRNA(fMet)-specific endonuclease VapC